MNVLYFSQYFPPENTASSRRAYDTAYGLVAAGHQVTLIVEVPNHPQGIIPQEFAGKLFQRKKMDGLDVIYVWVKASPVKDFHSRLFFYFSYMITAILAGLFVARQRYDVVFSTSPPLFVGGAGLVVSWLRRTPFVFEAIDLWPEAAVTVGELKNPRFIRWATRLEEACYRRAEKIFLTAQEMIERLVERGMPREKLVLIRNGARTDLFFKDTNARAKIRAELDFTDAFVVLFAGLHGLAYDLLGLMNVAHLLRDEKDIHFLLVGDGILKEQMQKRAIELNLSNVMFLPTQSRERIPAYFNASDALVVPMREPHIVGTLPVKIYDAMASELPLIVAAEGEPVTVVLESDAGVVVSPENAEKLAEMILSVRKDKDARVRWGRNGRRAVEKQYAIAAQVQLFISALEDIGQAD